MGCTRGGAPLATPAGGGRVPLAVIDHVVSVAPVRFPVARLCALCRRHGAASLVDGAHAAGALPLDVPALGCDAYTSNLHKCARRLGPWDHSGAA